MERQRVFTSAPWELQVGYCRAIRVGSQVYVTGTAPVGEDGEVYAPGEPYAQARRCLEIIQKALSDVGASVSDIVRTRMFVTDINLWEEFGRAHAEFLGDHPPATAMVEVRALIHPAMLIEIEADAVVSQWRDARRRVRLRAQTSMDTTERVPPTKVSQWYWR